MMEELYSQLKEIKMEYLQLFLEKTRSFEYRWEKVEYYENQKWQESYKGFFYDSEITKIDNVPVGQDNYAQYTGLIRYAQEAEVALNSPEECPIMFQGLEPLQFQLITDFYLTGISTEISIGSKYVPIPYCTTEAHDLHEIPFKLGQATLLYLVDWSEPS